MLRVSVRACKLALAVIMQGGMINTQSGSAQASNYLVNHNVTELILCRSLAEHAQEAGISRLIDNPQGQLHTFLREVYAVL